jgi:hypothetical protein
MVPREEYNHLAFTMARKPTHLGKILVTAIAFLLLCGIVVGEFPELVSLTDNATNDFTLIKARSAACPILPVARKHLPASHVNSNTLAPALLFSRLSPFQESATIPPKRSALYSVLRT